MYAPLRSGVIRVSLIPTMIDSSNTDKANAPFLVTLIVAHAFIFSLSFHPVHTISRPRIPLHIHGLFRDAPPFVYPSLHAHPNAPPHQLLSSTQEGSDAHLYAHLNHQAWKASWEGEHSTSYSARASCTSWDTLPGRLWARTNTLSLKPAGAWSCLVILVGRRAHLRA